jgi:hypothetical protein
MVNKYSVDFGVLEQRLEPQKPVYKYADVKHRLVKVAFDVVRFMDTDNIDGLWQIKNTEDGDVIVAMYDDATSDQEKMASNWSALPDMAGDINLFYKNDPVTKVSLAKIAMTGEDPDSVCSTLASKLSTNQKLLASLLSGLTTHEREELLTAHPELKG